MTPNASGWVHKDNRFRIQWFDGDQIQNNVGRTVDESPVDKGSDDDTDNQ